MREEGEGGGRMVRKGRVREVREEEGRVRKGRVREVREEEGRVG